MHHVMLCYVMHDAPMVGCTFVVDVVPHSLFCMSNSDPPMPDEVQSREGRTVKMYTLGIQENNKASREQ